MIGATSGERRQAFGWHAWPSSYTQLQRGQPCDATKTARCAATAWRKQMWSNAAGRGEYEGGSHSLWVDIVEVAAADVFPDLNGLCSAHKARVKSQKFIHDFRRYNMPMLGKNRAGAYAACNEHVMAIFDRPSQDRSSRTLPSTHHRKTHFLLVSPPSPRYPFSFHFFRPCP